MKKVLAIVLAAAMLFALALPVAAAQNQASEVLRLTNELRAAQGRGSVRSHAGLNAAAQTRAREAAARWSHTRPCGREFHTVLAEHNVRARAASENLAFTGTPASAQRAVGNWVNSPSHRDNLMNSAHTHMGIGIYFCRTSNRYFWAQLFITAPNWTDNILFAFQSIWNLLFGWIG